MLTFLLQPKTSKVDMEAPKKAYNTIPQFLSHTLGWMQATVIEKLYTSLEEPLLISPLFLCSLTHIPNAVMVKAINILHSSKFNQFFSANKKKGKSCKSRSGKSISKAGTFIKHMLL